MRVGSWTNARAMRAQVAYRMYVGDRGWRRRAREIAKLPSKVWRGPSGKREPVRVFAITCQADFGKGPHQLWVPEGVLWSLIDLSWYRCPHHR